jgi:NAD(P)H-quinone oxidoreductase subunit 5
MTSERLLTILVAAPGALFALLSLLWLLGWHPPERFIARLTSTLYSVMAAGSLWLGWRMCFENIDAVQTTAGHWLQAGSYHFELSLFADHLSLPLITLTIVLVGLVGVFSVRYVHRDRGFFRFFVLLHLFAFGALLVLASANFDLLLAGWELVGISSVLLIAFFDERQEPVRNAIRVFAFYRIADLGLLLGIFLLHHLAHTTGVLSLFRGSWPDESTMLDQPAATLIGLLLLMAAAGKSAQIPFSGWLPRAMEGPTPSSAIFYGAISVHLGAYLLLRAEPILRAAPWAAAAVAAVGAVTAFLATLVHRASSDAKNALACAGMAQLGIIFCEIALGFPRLALVHMIGHAIVRTLQFLRAPSMLHDYHRVHAAAGGDMGKTGAHYERVLPHGVRFWLYRAAVERGYYDALLDRIVTTPVLRLARWCASFESGRPGPSRLPRKPALAPESQWAERIRS